MNIRATLTFLLFLTLLATSFSFADGMIGDSESIRARGGVGNYLFRQDYREPGKTDAILSKKTARRGNLESTNLRDDSVGYGSDGHEPSDSELTYGEFDADDSLTMSASSAQIGDEKARSVEFGTIHFPPSSAKIPGSEKARLDRIALFLNEDPALSVQVVGDSDPQTDRSPGHDLAESRAQNVVEQLKKRGVSDAQLSWTARSKTNRAGNRRVEILFE